MRALMAAVIIMGIMIIIGVTVLVYELTARAGGSIDKIENKTISAEAQTGLSQASPFPLAKTERIISIQQNHNNNTILIHTKGVGSSEMLYILNGTGDTLVNSITLKDR